jgi:hypothetical protein
MTKNNLSIAAVVGLFLAQAVNAGEVADLTVFKAGTKAVAAEVNGNFEAVKTAVNDNNARIAALEELVQSLKATVEAQASTISALEEKLANVSVVTHNGQPTVRFSGVNVQIVNGLGSTDTINGTGNLIVGYDEATTDPRSLCTIGWNDTTAAPVTDEASCAAVGGTWTSEGFKTGSHYIVAGKGNNYSRFGGVVFGYENTSNFDYANVTGGYRNTASGRQATVSGGGGGSATHVWSSVSGGFSNVASAPYASVSGGSRNVASGNQASVSGGRESEASGENASISGGTSNKAMAFASSVSGGRENTASGYRGRRISWVRRVPGTPAMRTSQSGRSPFTS